MIDSVQQTSVSLCCRRQPGTAGFANASPGQHYVALLGARWGRLGGADLGQVAPALQVQGRHEVSQPCRAAPVLPGQHEVQEGPKVHLVGAALGPGVLAGYHMLLVHSVKKDLGEGSSCVPVPHHLMPAHESSQVVPRCAEVKHSHCRREVLAADDTLLKP